jgi:hypothetical protein
VTPSVGLLLAGRRDVLGAYAGHGPSDLEVARASTAPYQQLHVAIHSGYGLFPDAAGIACIDMPGMGAMGIHYANGDLFADPAIDAGHPEALVYEPTVNGRLKLVALEYVVLQSAWDATHSSPPELFGQRFNFTAAGNRFGVPAYYSLHAWIWKHNPAGTFEMWNPNVSCPA